MQPLGSDPAGMAATKEHHMNRLDFLHQLYLSLERVPEPDRRNLVRDFEAHFQLAQQEGRTEEETASALGDPKRIAQELATHYFASKGGARGQGTPPPGWVPPSQDWSRQGPLRPRGAARKAIGITLIVLGLGALALSLLFFPLLYNVRGSETNRVTVGIRELAGELVHAVDETVSAPTASLREIHISSVSEDIRFNLTDSDTLTARLQGSVTTTNPNALPRLVQEQTGDTLTLRVVQDGVMVGFYTGQVTLDIDMPASWAGALAVASSSAEVSLPETVLESLDVQTVSGDIDIGPLKTTRETSLQTSSGQVILNGAACDTFRLSTVSGDMVLEDIRCRGNAQLETSSGQMEITNLESNTLHVTAVSGDISLTGVVADIVKAEGSSSATTLNNVTADAEIKTVSGDITLDGVVPKSRVQLESSSGAVRASLPVRLPDSERQQQLRHDGRGPHPLRRQPRRAHVDRHARKRRRRAHHRHRFR